MRTLDFYIRGDDVLFRCVSCGDEAPINRYVPFMTQLRAIAQTHDCWVPFEMPHPRSEQRPELRLVASPEEPVRAFGGGGGI